MFRREIIKTLFKATLLISRAVHKEISITEFSKVYDSFFYYEALDGHEADETQKEVLREFKDAIDLHEQVQTTVVDLLYTGNAEKRQLYLDTGRIDEEQAKRRLQALSEQFDLQKIVSRLKAQHDANED